MERWEAKLALDAGARLGEGPVWSAEEQVLYWLDIEQRRVHRFDPATAVDDHVDLEEMPGALVLRRSGGAMLALQNGFAACGGWPFHPALEAAVDGDRAELRMNDGACDARGRFWAGTMRVDGSGAEAALYRLGVDGQVTRMLGGVGISNGIAWSSDETRMYYVDTPTHGIDVFDFDPVGGEISNRRRLVEIDAADGEPDGLVLDEEDCLWVALWNGWAVRRYSPRGELMGVVDVPAARVTKCAFGGPHLDDLFVTTASPEAPDAAQPHAGGLFHASTGVRGRPSNLYAG